jgi:hypothetical protein
MATDTKKYLDYLDKEMTIMGILSAVAIAAPAGVLNALLGTKDYFKDQLWAAGPFFVVIGSILCVLSAALFYKERSLLAWYYGQMCLTESLDDGNDISRQLRVYMRDADSWETWIPYSWGFTALVAGFVEYCSAILLVLARTNSTMSSWMIVIGRVLPFLAIAIALVQRYVWKHYSFSDAPWADFWSDVRRPRRAGLPHDWVYTRLGPSNISGVGVFAIQDIPEGTYIFEPDDDVLVSINKQAIENLAPALRRLYEDFCVLKNDTYQCPSSFNKLTPSWYLNCSKRDANVKADSSLRFYASRKIESGEELTADYSTYSDIVLREPDEAADKT